ncbi:relaxase/mobilization nuclease [Streptomyces sp. NPDC004111]|uniref:relaxase/mobilization nuclease n=1 Tax=Streptomyces sp. NPDC004111 TaxID=3364690 RepID=UPI00369EA50F
MIPRLHERAHDPTEPLSAALGRPVSPHDGLTEHTVVAHWPGLDRYTLDDEQRMWTAAQWAEHLQDPLLEQPFAAGPQGDRRAIFHLSVRLHPADRDLTGTEWAEIGHRLARSAGIEVPGRDGCRWIAVQAQRARLDVLGNLIRLDGSWYAPHRVLPRLADEARRLETDLHLIPARSETASVQQPAHGAAEQLARVLAPLVDEQSGPLATVRGLVEHTAHRLARQPQAAHGEAAHRLELIARRLHAVQQDLDAVVVRLTTPPRPQGAAPHHALPATPFAAPSGRPAP